MALRHCVDVFASEAIYVFWPAAAEKTGLGYRGHTGNGKSHEIRETHGTHETRETRGIVRLVRFFKVQKHSKFKH